MRYLYLLPLLMVLGFSSLSYGQDNARRYNQINLHSEASQVVNNDQLTVTLLIEETGLDAKFVAKRVEKRMQKILRELRFHNDIQAQTSNKTTQPVFSNNPISEWKTTQIANLTSTNIKALSDLTNKLNRFAQVQSFTFNVSAQAQDKIKQQLTAQAIAKFKQKASLIAREFGKTSYTLLSVNISSDYRQAPSQSSNNNTGLNYLHIYVDGSIELTPH